MRPPKDGSASNRDETGKEPKATTWLDGYRADMPTALNIENVAKRALMLGGDITWSSPNRIGQKLLGEVGNMKDG